MSETPDILPPCRTVDDVLITGELARRSSRPRDLEVENGAMLTLVEELTTNPHGVLQKVAELAMELTHSHSAGIGILEPGGENGFFRWHAAAGAFAPNLHGTIAREANPCGVGIERNQVLLFSQAERFFPALRGVEPRIYENLLVPWELDGKAIGTLWVMKHSPEDRFDAEDARLLGTFSRYAAAAWAMLKRTRAAEERAQARAALNENEGWMRLIVENARDFAIFSLDRDRRVTSWNNGAQNLLGYKEDEMMSESGDIIFTAEDRADGAPEREAATALAKGRAEDERWHVRKDRSRFWGSGVMMAMRDAHGEPVGFVKIFRDQTAAFNAQRALEESYEQLRNALQEAAQARAKAEAAGKAKDHFLAVLSHELRTPLMPVLTVTRALARRKDLPAEAKQALEMIQRNVQIEAQFIEELLDLTRIRHGKLELVREPMDMHEAVRHALEVSAPDIKARKQRLTIALEAEHHQVSGDFVRLQQVFWNLLKNASKFTPEKGEICVRSHNDQPGQIVIKVSDTGRGIEPEAFSKIFDAFVQADESVTREFGGLGLGLALAKATVTAHGGNIRVESTGRDQGATFIVELPLLNSL